ncbi:hypothetical protein LAZ67_14002301 [Cordylochernes scorpioides]|uniref:Uncharacterized protein n=1 Tax=Cordylochernes scorpioides TaxID=51811 RepID=A0ABY6LAD7_9ARAC|nr:hypothetical protein LAZ67_14002301 [Cordylochernes scorpioides]
MPRKRSAIGVSTPAARRMAARAARGQSSRTLENPQQSQARLQSDRLRHRVQRASENPQQSQARLQSDRLRHRVQRASENPQQSQARLQSDRLHHRVQRASETPQQSQTRQEAYQLRYFRQRASTWADMLNAAFHYNPALNYEQFTFLQIGQMDKQCQHCTAFKYNGERPGMCCSAVKVRIPDLVWYGMVVVLCCQVTCQRLRSKARSIIELALFCHHSTLIAANYSQHSFRFSSSEIVVQRLPPAIETFPSLSPTLLAFCKICCINIILMSICSKLPLKKCLLLIASWSLRLTKHRLDTILAHSMLQPLMRLPLLLCRKTVTDVTLFFTKEAVVCRGLTSFTGLV